MSYLALYRKYRPVKFSEVIGQKHITETFGNILKLGKVSHAYLLTGTRGIGKTSVAKIFARAINCLSPDSDGSPCVRCKLCVMAENLDIMEIDAASNNGVDEIRELRDKVRYHPANSKYKVYIIDEAHMLTPGAFNALLKTLEEPPEHTVFILATTEVHKLPATILSRCMRFDFRLIPQEELKELLKKVFSDAGQKADEDALNMIAALGQGSARDTLSIADMCSSFAPENIRFTDVLQVVGAGDPSEMIDLCELILAGNSSEVIARVNDLASKGKNINVLARDLTAVFRDISIAGTVKNPEKLIALPKKLLERMKKIAAESSAAMRVYCIDVLSGIEQDLRYGLSPLVVLENALLKCMNVLAVGGDLNALLARLDTLEKAFEKERLRRSGG
jgi:DNA polymerase-3 subunit gamma/tau